MIRSRSKFWSLLLVMVLVLAACGGGDDDTSSEESEESTTSEETASSETTVASDSGSSDAGLTGSILIDGSSTVFPITQAVAEEFTAANPGVEISVGVSGTGGGFKKFCPGETDISDASRPIKDKERNLCYEGGTEFTELQVGVDALSVVVPTSNDWATCLTVEELGKIWGADSTITNWKDVRAGFPDVALDLYGPGTDSGTFDFFNEEITEDLGGSRSDYTASEDDNVLVNGVSGSAGGLGYFGLAYYEENKDKLSAVEVDAGKGCIGPEGAFSGTYGLARPLFIYVNDAKAKDPVIKAFVDFYFDSLDPIVEAVGYIPMLQDAADRQLEYWQVISGDSTLSGEILIDGSSTVFPVTQAVAEEFTAIHSDVAISVGVSGTGGGFKKFCPGETMISDASRPIKDKEKALCEENGVGYLEIQVGIDALSVVVPTSNDWATCLTTAELTSIWGADSTITNWKDVRAGFPDVALDLYGPGTDSGTFDFFNEEITEDLGGSRSDYTASEDDNVLVNGVSGSAGGLGYFGLAYYEENKDKLTAVEVDAGDGCQPPEAAFEGNYFLARPLFIYVAEAAKGMSQVRQFVDFYFVAMDAIVPAVGYVPMLPEQKMASLMGWSAFSRG